MLPRFKVCKYSSSLLFFLCFLFSLLFFVHPVKAAVLFEDNFETHGANKWEVKENTCGSLWDINDGKYGIVINHYSCATNVVPKDEYWDLSWNDYIFEVDMDFVSGTDHNLAFRYTYPNIWYGIHFQVSDNPDLSTVTLESVASGYQNKVNYPAVNGQSYHIKVIMNGDYIQFFIGDDLVIDYPSAGGGKPTGKIALRAGAGADPHSETWFDNVRVTTIDHVEAPEENIPVVLLPGLSGSWNTQALITGGQGGNWKKVPFVKVYDNLRSTFLDNAGYTEGEDYFEFYYDWRKPLNELANGLRDYLENTVLDGKLPETKVNLVGHSMGGMVARAYGQTYGEDKINKIVTSGSPHEGVISAWKAWSGASVGERWSWEWIGLQLYLHMHKLKYSSPVATVHGLTPGLADLLPIFDFAKDKNDQVIDVTTMDSFNTYLESLKNTLTNDLKAILNTIAGINQETDEWIKLGERSLTDRAIR